MGAEEIQRRFLPKGRAELGPPLIRPCPASEFPHMARWAERRIATPPVGPRTSRLPQFRMSSISLAVADRTKSGL
jgi:hypothetical protein